MDRNQIVNELFEELGASLELPAIIQTGDENWAIFLDEQDIIEVTHNVERKCLVFAMELGEPEGKDVAEVYKQLLAFSSLEERTGGVRMALTSPEGEVQQMLDVFTEELKPNELIHIVQSFVELGKQWREILLAPTDELDASTISTTSTFSVGDSEEPAVSVPFRSRMRV